MAKGKVLTKEIAKAYVTGGYRWVSSQTDYFASIDEDAAQVLSKFKKGDLHLDGLKAIPEKVAQLLALQNSENAGLHLSLGGLTSISDSVAEDLSKYQGKGGLHLSGLKKISDSAALKISKLVGMNLDLGGLEDISEASATALSEFKGENEMGVGNLNLSGLSTITEPIAAALGKFKGSTLQLNGLTSLSEACAHSLSNSKADLYLNGFESISDEVSKALSSHRGSKYTGSLSLCGLKTLSDDAACHLAQHKKDIFLFGLLSLGEKGAEAFAKTKPRLVLYKDALEAFEKAKAKLKTKRKTNKKASK